MRQSSKYGKLVAACAIALGVAAVSHFARADQPAPETASAEVVTATATVQKIDKDQRMVTLKGAQGNVLDVKVGPNVNLDKIKVGDRVNSAYYEEVALSLNKSGEQPSKMTQTTTERGGITAQQTTVTAKVVSVDTAKNMVVLQGPQGGIHSIHVQDPDLQAKLKKLKPGDNLDVTYTQAVAISIEPMQQMK
jgi:Cu/Ag efflux protein CusF